MKRWVAGWAGASESILTLLARRIETRPRRSCSSATPAASSAVVKLSARFTSSDRTYLVRLGVEAG